MMKHMYYKENDEIMKMNGIRNHYVQKYKPVLECILYFFSYGCVCERGESKKMNNKKARKDLECDDEAK